MTPEEKQLLLKDLCARLPYGVNVQPSSSVAFPHKFKGYDKGLVRIDTDQRYELEHIKPYLRPMSSMTEEEREEREMYRLVRGGWTDEGFDWLNEHHFDYRGLIEKGLALEAPEDMYKTE